MKFRGRSLGSTELPNAGPEQADMLPNTGTEQNSALTVLGLTSLLGASALAYRKKEN